MGWPPPIVLAPAAAMLALVGCLDAGLSRCANGRVCPQGYRCDDALDRCVGTPSTQVCGDLFVSDGEECDDGNLSSHDGCSSNCLIEIPVWRALPGIPGARRQHAMAYDAHRGRIVVFGGIDAANATIGDTVEWDGTSWRTASPATSPAARYGAGMAYDPNTRAIVLYGGRDNTTPYGDTWKWDGTSWMLLAGGDANTTRFWHAVALDAQQGRLVSFGGNFNLQITEPTDQTDAWTGTTWTTVFGSTVSTPGPRARTVMTAYDRGAFMHGGSGLSTFPHDDTWRWDGADWMRIQASGPGRRTAHAMAYEGAGRVVLFGGFESAPNSFADTWLWDGNRWSNLDVTGPTMRESHALAYDAVRRATLLVGGHVSSTELDEVWMFRFEREGAPDETCIAGEDADGDGRSGCDDIDCWGVCTPHCPPTLMTMPCDAGAPRCGDGTCNANLELAACPEDCP